MSGPKFKKKYNDTTVEKTISFFRKRMSDKKESLICNSVEKILKECNEDTRNGIILYLNRFSKWYAKYYEKLPGDDFKMVYLKTICILWRNKNNERWAVMGLDETKDGHDLMTHVSNLFAALFRSERYRLYNL